MTAEKTDLILDVLASLALGASDLEHTFYIDLVREKRRKLAERDSIDGEAVPGP